MAAATLLTPNDAHVLTALFDAEASPSAQLKLDASLPSYPHISTSTLASLRVAENTAIRPLNTPSPSAMQLSQAEDALTAIIEQEPQYASAYANRAQVRRLRIGDTLFKEKLAPVGDSEQVVSEETTRIFEDLTTAIDICAPSSPTASLSTTTASLLASTHTHRGYLLMRASTLASVSESHTLETGPSDLRGLSRDDLEGMASRDFFLGGRYGNREARDLSVRTNPYAKMCGTIVKEAMKKEMEEFREWR